MRALVVRDLRLALRRRADPLSVLVFFVLVASLFPLGVGPGAGLAAHHGAGRGVRGGAAGGDVVARAPVCRRLPGRHAGAAAAVGLSAAAAGGWPRSLAHWICSGLLLALVSPLLALQFDLGWPATGVLLLALLVATPLLSLIGAVGAALTVGVRGAAVLMPLLVLPLCVPVLIFGTAAVDASRTGMVGRQAISRLLLAFLVLAAGRCALGDGHRLADRAGMMPLARPDYPDRRWPLWRLG